MKYAKYCFALLLISGVVIKTTAQEQTTACAQVLRSARAVYEDGRLHEMPTLLSSCLNTGFSKEERVEALRLLTLTYLYLGEPIKAEESMVRLLKADSFFEINEVVDPTEFINLYRQYRTDPIFNVGFYFGVNNTQNSITTVHYVFPDGAGKGKFTGAININLGIAFEKELTDKITINPELAMISRSFSYSNNDLFYDSTGVATENSGISATLSQTWLDFNALVQYKFYEKRNSNFYVFLGPGIQYLLKNSVQAETRNGTQVIIGPGIDLRNTNNSINYAATLGFGGRIRLGAIYFRPDIRYQYGLNNIIDPNNRQQNDSEALLRYGLPNSDYRTNAIQVNLAIVYPIFSPKKLTQ